MAAELRTLAATLAHGPRFRCMNGPVLAAHSLGRVQEALRPAPDPTAPDYLSGRSGNKLRYARLFVEALDLAQIPVPLQAILSCR